MQSFAISALSRRLSRKLSLSIFNRQVFKKDVEPDPIDIEAIRYKPEGLDALCRTTKFSRKELKIMYRGFKQECPSGVVKEDTFKDIYAQFFPQCDSTTYAHYVFKVFDQDHDGTVSFEEFVMGLSVLARGTIHEKLIWAFNLYDANGDGVITREELSDIVTAVYELLGKYAEPTMEDRTIRDHVDFIFTKMDMNNDGNISVEEFLEACRTDENISKSMTMFDTVL